MQRMKQMQVKGENISKKEILLAVGFGLPHGLSRTKEAVICAGPAVLTLALPWYASMSCWNALPAAHLLGGA